MLLNNVKTIVLFLVVFTLFNSADAQTYEMDNVDGQTINTCSGVFYDSQALFLNNDFYYNVGEDYQVTFCSSIPGNAIRFDFDSIQIYAPEDTLWVYDGPNTASPLVAVYAGGYLATSVIGYSGCLTFVFKSTGQFVSSGWRAVISCINIPPVPLQPGCTNMGFENGNFAGWYGTYGYSMAIGSPGAPTPTYVPDFWNTTASAHHTITTGAGLDPYGNFPIVSPTGGNNSMMLGDANIAGYGGASIEQKFTVTAANAMMIYSYAVVIQNALDINQQPHLSEQQPFFNINVFDCNGDTIACGEYLVVGGPNIPGFSVSPIDPDVYYKPWSDVFLDLTPYLNTCVTIKFTVGDCALGAHWGYVYLDALCGPMAITGNQFICPDDSTTLFAPKGGAAYLWTPGGETTDSIRVSPAVQTPYSCTITSVAGPQCTTTLNYLVNVYPRPLIWSTSDTICVGEQATLTATPSTLGGSYLWAPGGQITPAITVSPIITTVYTCSFTDLNGCTHDSTGTVTVNLLPPAIDQNDTLCEDVPGGGTVANVDLTLLNALVDGGTNAVVSWFSNATLTILVPTPTSVTVSNLLTFYVLVSNGNCQDTAIVTYTVNPVPVAPTVANVTLCPNNTTTLTATAPGGTYEWFDAAVAGNLLFTGASYITPLLAVNTTYYVQSTLNGCTGPRSPVTVTISPNLVVNAGPNDTICIGDPYTLTVNPNGPGYTYVWDEPTNLGFSNIFNPTVNPAATTTYTVTVTNSSNCVGTDTVTISISPPISIPNVINHVSCFGVNDGQVTVAPQGGTPAYSYSWSVGNFGNSPIANNLPGGTLTVTVTDIHGCSQDSTFTVLEPTPPVISFDADIYSGCSPLTVEFTNTTDPNIMTSFTWSFGNGSSGTTSPISTTYIFPGTYDVSLTVIDTAGCATKLIKPAFIRVFNDPVANFTMTPNPTTMLDPTIQFYDQSIINIVSWSWDMGGFSSSTMQNPTYTFPEDTGEYVVMLAVIDANGCKDTTYKNIIIRGDYGIFIPNAYTPDEDGVNDGFFPKGFGISNDEYTMLIFTRWGELIFESHKKFQPWYGDYLGEIVQNGLYVWKLDFRDINGNDHSRVGHVSIIK